MKKTTVQKAAEEIKVLKARIKELEELKSGKARAEEELKREESFLASVFFSIQDGISVLDTDMRIVMVNPTMEQWYAHAMPVVGKKCYEAYHSRTTPCEVCPTRRTLNEGGAAREIVPRRGKDGAVTGWFDLYSFPLLDAKTKKPIGAIEYARDITERKAAEEELGETLMRFVAVIERIDEGITLSDAKGHFIIYNSKMGELTGYTMQEANNDRDFLDVLFPDPKERRKAKERLGEVIKSGGVYEVEATVRAKDGTDKTLLISTVLMRRRREDMFLSVYRDITKFKKMDELKDEFIGTVSHELRSPLSIVKEGISLVLDEIPGKINEQQAKVLTGAKVNAERLIRIINDLLDISKIEAGMLEIRKDTVDLAEILKQTITAFGKKAKNKNIELKTDFPEGGIRVYADADRVVQVVTNLLGNAIKFTSRGYIEISAREGRDAVECAVSDTGIGISKDNIPKLFGKFQQFERPESGEKGTGLGLSIARKIVEMHGGTITVDSQAGKGTKVTFTVPKKR